MTREALLEVVKEMATQVMLTEAGATKTEGQIRGELESRLRLDAPLTELGWDSVRLTWLLVRIEERFDIDTSGISMYDLFTVEDLVDELLQRID